MTKTLLITGSTDGIGLETAKALLAQGHRVLIHGRSAARLAPLQAQLAAQFGADKVQAWAADLAQLDEVRSLAGRLIASGVRIDALINNAGVFKLAQPQTDSGIDVRFVVNTIAPWLLTRLLLPALATDGRVINLSSAAQAPVNLAALRGEVSISDDFSAYAQSKLALTMWSMEPARLGLAGAQSMVAVNPGSFLASKMVREGFGRQGHDIGIGVRILSKLALEPGAVLSGRYFDNDAGRYADPHQEALSGARRALVCDAVSATAKAEG
jgi:NAD(P)-dependent dehydrogenase (short-subunit alcohol dehydrogenase family)